MNFTVGHQTRRFRHGDTPDHCLKLARFRYPQRAFRTVDSIPSGPDNAFNGMANQSVDQVSNDVYGAKTLNNFLNPTAFAPLPGGFGTSARNSIKGPGFHKVDLALSRLVSLAATRTIELRLEVFNLFNTFNWGCRTTTSPRVRSGGLPR
jgi:hypothetical protein